MVSWKDVLNFDVISAFIKQVTGVEMDEELKEKGFNELRNNFSEQEIYEMEAAEIEQELIKIYLDVLKKKGVTVKKRIRMPFPMVGGLIPSGMLDPQQIKSILKVHPELRKLFEEILSEDDDEEDDSEDDGFRDMYV